MELTLPEKIKLSNPKIQRAGGDNLATWTAPDVLPKAFYEIEIPQHIQTAYAPSTLHDEDVNTFVKGDVPANTFFKAQHHPIFIEGKLLSGARIEGRNANIVSASALEPKAKIEKAKIVILGASSYIPNEKTMEQIVESGTPIFVVPEEKRQEVFCRMSNMITDTRGQEALEHLDDKQFEAMSDEELEILAGPDVLSSKHKNINSIIQRFYNQGLLKAVFANGCSAIDTSKLQGKA